MGGFRGRIAQDPSDGASAGEDGASPRAGASVDTPPTALCRFNWGAYVLFPIWALANRDYLLLGLFALLAAVNHLATWLEIGVGPAGLGIRVLAYSAAALWCGARANARQWQRIRISPREGGCTQPEHGSAAAVEAYLARQRAWAAVGLLVLLSSVARQTATVFSPGEVAEHHVLLAGSLASTGAALMVAWMLARGRAATRRRG